jgi:hypothetical protein
MNHGLGFVGGLERIPTNPKYLNSNDLPEFALQFALFRDSGANNFNQEISFVTQIRERPP